MCLKIESMPCDAGASRASAGSSRNAPPFEAHETRRSRRSSRSSRPCSPRNHTDSHRGLEHASATLTSQPPALAGPGMKWVLVREDYKIEPLESTNPDQVADPLSVSGYMTSQLIGTANADEDEMMTMLSPSRDTPRYDGGGWSSYVEDHLSHAAAADRQREVLTLQNQLRHTEFIRDRCVFHALPAAHTF